MKRVIGTISRILPDWCKILTLPKGNIVRLERKEKYQIGEIK